MLPFTLGPSQVKPLPVLHFVQQVSSVLVPAHILTRHGVYICGTVGGEDGTLVGLTACWQLIEIMDPVCIGCRCFVKQGFLWISILPILSLRYLYLHVKTTSTLLLGRLRRQALSNPDCDR